jgi:hypothetical protein
VRRLDTGPLLLAHANHFALFWRGDALISLASTRTEQRGSTEKRSRLECHRPRYKHRFVSAAVFRGARGHIQILLQSVVFTLAL